LNQTKQPAPHKLVSLRVKLAWRRKDLRYLSGRTKINHRFKLISMSAATAVLAASARVLSGVGIIGPAWAAILLLMGSIFGAIVLATLVHAWLERHFASFRSAKTLAVGLLALASFVAHGQAVGEVNAIFEIDASALPHTTAAAAAMVIGNWALWIVLLPVCIVSAVCLCVFYGRSRYGESTISFAILMASLTWGALVFQQAGPELRRKSNLYQIALAMDFNKRSHCDGLPEGTEGVVFIGPDQKRAIVAPRKVVVPTLGDFGVLVPQIKIPESFKIVECE
jgi:hypothetical protein